MKVRPDTTNVGKLRMLDGRLAADYAVWLRRWSAWPEREPFAHPAFLLAMSMPDERPMCATFDLDTGGVLYPFILRDIPFSSGGFRDITGPKVGYTGAFQWGANHRDGLAFWSQFTEWAAAERVVASFTRLSLFTEGMLDFDGDLREVQPNIVRTLQVTDAELWRDVEPKVRKNVQRARREGVRITLEATAASLRDFLEVYKGTMDRRGASSTFAFKYSVIDALISRLGAATRMYLARLDGEPLAAELVLLSARHAYSFLGGTSASAFKLRPNDLLKYEIIRDLRDQGLTDFVLGGGPSPRDGIYRYKHSFAPRGVIPFYVAERVYDPNQYELLARQHRQDKGALEDGSGSAPPFFPVYRTPHANPKPLLNGGACDPIASSSTPRRAE